MRPFPTARLATGLLVAIVAGCTPVADRVVAPEGIRGPTAAEVAAAAPPPVYIAEVHYDDASADEGEAVEVSAPAGTDLTGWTIALYNGSSSQRNVYATLTLSGTVADQCGGRGVVVVDAPGIQNGSPDGLALVNAQGAIVEFLSYEGTFEAASGPAQGMTATDIGVTESGSEAEGQSLQRSASGAWSGPAASSFGACNAEVEPPGEVATVDVAPDAVTIAEGATQQLDVTARDAEGREVPDATVTWSSNDPAVATVSATGLVTGVAEGVTHVVAISGAIRDSATITVVAGGGNDAAARVSELHYDNSGSDVGERVEVEGNAGASLAGWTLVLYSGTPTSSTAGQSYGTIALAGVFPSQCGGRGVLTFDVPGLQNGDADGLALVDVQGVVVELLSYEGSFTAVNGPAAGRTATDIGVAEGSSASADGSLQRAGNGQWFGPEAHTFGACNPATPPAGPTGIVLEGYSFRGSAPIPVGFGELYRVKDVATGDFVRTGLTWTTSAPGVATVDERGNVTATGAGTATITATETATGRTASTTVTTTVFTYSDLSVYADELQFGTPQDGTPGDEQLVNRATFAASWNPARGQPNWVAYNLEATHRLNVVDRCDCFVHDPALPAGLPEVTTADYDGSGYSRGHMTMSADRTRGALDNAETFYYTNIIPQTSQNNAGPWLELEQYLGDLAVSQDREIFVFAGGAAYSGTLNDAGRVAIPTRTWKIAVILDRNEGIADVRSAADVRIIAVDMPNTTTVSGGWEQFRTSVDQIEQLTGYDFLALLPDAIESVVESQVNVTNHEIDVQPARISLAGTPIVSVVLYSRPGFDAAALDAAALRLVVHGGGAVEPNRRGAAVNTSVRDVDGDGDLDRLIAFRTADLRAAGLGAGTADLMLRLAGATWPWEARDASPAVVVP
jgi:DNA/RNA endonuclease G (NUC1)